MAVSNAFWNSWVASILGCADLSPPEHDEINITKIKRNENGRNDAHCLYVIMNGHPGSEIIIAMLNKFQHILFIILMCLPKKEWVDYNHFTGAWLSPARAHGSGP